MLLLCTDSNCWRLDCWFFLLSAVLNDILVNTKPGVVACMFFILLFFDFGCTINTNFMLTTTIDKSSFIQTLLIKIQKLFICKCAVNAAAQCSVRNNDLFLFV